MSDLKPMLASWGRSFLAAAIATYTVQGLNWKALLASGLSAIFPVILRWANPNDVTFGVKQ